MILKALLIVFATASISFLVSHGTIFDGLRGWIRPRVVFLAKLIECCYCLGHWISLVLIFAMQVTLFGIFRPLDYLLTWLVISWIAGVLSMATGRLWSE